MANQRISLQVLRSKSEEDPGVALHHQLIPWSSWTAVSVPHCVYPQMFANPQPSELRTQQISAPCRIPRYFILVERRRFSPILQHAVRRGVLLDDLIQRRCWRPRVHRTSSARIAFDQRAHTQSPRRPLPRAAIRYMRGSRNQQQPQFHSCCETYIVSGEKTSLANNPSDQQCTVRREFAAVILRGPAGAVEQAGPTCNGRHRQATSWAPYPSRQRPS